MKRNVIATVIGRVVAELKREYRDKVQRLMPEVEEEYEYPFNVDMKARPSLLEEAFREKDIEVPEPPIEVPKSTEVTFSGFIDGVQRVVKVCVFPEFGTPFYVAQICSGALIREGKRLSPPQNTSPRMKILFVAPFKGLEEEYPGIREIVNQGIEEGTKRLIEGEVGDVAEDQDRGFLKKFVNDEATFVICDITNPGIEREDEFGYEGAEGDEREGGERSLTGDRLYDVGYVSSRARGRVATLRQILEVATLSELREELGEEKWILIDGPLIFPEKWARRLDFDASETLKNVVGYVKTLRAKPDSRLLKEAIKLREGYRGGVFTLDEEVEGIERGYELRYGVPHISWYLRIRNPSGQETALWTRGLVRIDTYVSTYGFSRIKELKEEGGIEVVKTVNSISGAVLKERYPLPRAWYRRDVMITPIEEVENFLKGMLYDNLEIRSFTRMPYE